MTTTPIRTAIRQLRAAGHRVALVGAELTDLRTREIIDLVDEAGRVRDVCLSHWLRAAA